MITNKWIMGREGIQDALLIRREVFLQEQGVSPEEEFDGLDDRAFHLILYNDGVPAATGRPWPSEPVENSTPGTPLCETCPESLLPFW